MQRCMHYAMLQFCCVSVNYLSAGYCRRECISGCCQVAGRKRGAKAAEVCLRNERGTRHIKVHVTGETTSFQ